jgi:iron complex outermembrane receptor protein
MSIPYQRQAISLAVALTMAASAAAQEQTITEPAATPPPASAQPKPEPKSTVVRDDSAVIEEVVVTAQKREQNIQDTPIAMSALDSQALVDQKVNDISDITANTPNVQIAPSPGGTTGATVAIRGAASINPAVTWEPSVGLYVDGVFVAKNVGGLFDVAELERIEVLRGPQGTLYGKNTTGGAINLITRKPAEEFGGKVKVGAGNYG